mgnify:CR=1 FL=1
MRWYEYKMEVDDLHASDDLKAKLLAMQPAEEAPKPCLLYTSPSPRDTR